MKTLTKKELTEQLKEQIGLRSLDQEQRINTVKQLRAAEKRIEELEQLTKGTDAFQVSHPSNLNSHRYADHGIRIYTDNGSSKQLLTRIPLFTHHDGEADTQRKIELLGKLQKLLCEAYETFPDDTISIEMFMSEDYVNF
tara:strand:- start:119 stop:538 length:420 start_codon:yes stop_codon:yes gene_type:complete